MYTTMFSENAAHNANYFKNAEYSSLRLYF